MAVTVADLRTAVDTSLLHTGSATFSDTKKDHAIELAGNEFMRSTNAVITTTAFTVAAAASTLDLNATVTDFYADQWLWGYIGDNEVEMTTVRGIRRLRKAEVNGRPTHIAPRDEETYEISPTADIAYTLNISYRTLLTSWTLGGSSVTLNIPQEWAKQITWYGAKWYLIQGIPGMTRDAQAAKAGWDETLEKAKAFFTGTTPGLADVISRPSSTRAH